MGDVVHEDVVITSARLGADGALITASGELDVATVDTVREELNGAVAAGARRLVVDLRAVSFLDSITVAMLVHASRSVGGRFAVATRPDSYARLIFEVAGLLDALCVCDSLEDALASAGAT